MNGAGSWEIREGDALAVLPTLPEQSVQTCITSPPYWGLRDYGHDEQLGLEPTPAEYVANLVAIFAEVWRVLRDDGTLWLNLGDSYAGSWGAQGGEKGTAHALTCDMDEDCLCGVGSMSAGQIAAHPRKGSRTGSIPAGSNLKPKDLVGIPWMVAFALRDAGWYLRSEIIWAKPNPMPEPVRDRPTKAHEQIFLLTKRPRYFYDAEAIREESDPKQAAHNHRYARPYDNAERIASGQPGNVNNVGIHSRPGKAGRNKRSVWTISQQPFPDAHFATYPPNLIEPCILAGSPPKCCATCGAPHERIVEREAMVVRPTPKRKAFQLGDDHARTQVGGTMLSPPASRTLGRRATCGHDNGTAAATVLDPFCGAGTTGIVAVQHGRDFIGIELNPDYAEMTRDRIRRSEANPNGYLGRVEQIDGQMELA